MLPTAEPNAELRHAQSIISASRSAGVTECVYTSVVNAEKHAAFKAQIQMARIRPLTRKLVSLNEGWPQDSCPFYNVILDVISVEIDWLILCYV